MAKALYYRKRITYNNPQRIMRGWESRVPSLLL
ncbi:unnamed protein product, partial [marine sediment metagenome]